MRNQQRPLPRPPARPSGLATPAGNGRPQPPAPPPPRDESFIRLSASVRRALIQLDQVERAAVLDELLGRLREELEWQLALESAATGR